jgi:hypothetical protein
VTKKQIKDSWRNYWTRSQSSRELIKIKINDLKIGDIIDLDIDIPFSNKPHLIIAIREVNLNEVEFTFQLQSGERYESCRFNKNEFVF